jgi:hypothetical protein
MSKENGTAYPVAKKYEDIEMPANTALGTPYTLSPPVLPELFSSYPAKMNSKLKP